MRMGIRSTVLYHIVHEGHACYMTCPVCEYNVVLLCDSCALYLQVYSK